MERENVDRIVSFDEGFDRLAFVTRVYDGTAPSSAPTTS
jgi:predicted nucleic acid-binding protein